jgi:hypothetical protein
MFLIVVLSFVCVCIERYLLTELLNLPSHYLSFQAYNLLAGHFYWTFKTCFFVEICTFPLCLVSAPQLWIYINFCIKTIKLYYEVNFVISTALNSDWVIWMISLYVSLGSYRYGTSERNIIYVLIMNPGIGSWHFDFVFVCSVRNE